jgi:hypothetical protein
MKTIQEIDWDTEDLDKCAESSMRVLRMRVESVPMSLRGPHFSLSAGVYFRVFVIVTRPVLGKIREVRHNEN